MTLRISIFNIIIVAIKRDWCTADEPNAGRLSAWPKKEVVMPIPIPVLDPSFSPIFPSILEGAANPAGVTVADLVVDGSITDPDGAVEAIAIEALDTSLGAWQYSLDSGATWLTVRADLINSTTNNLALLLGPTDQIRLLPFGDLNGSLTDAITFRAWDMTSGSAGQYVVTTPGSGAFSSVSDTASIMVTPVNDVPTFAPVNGTGKAIVPVGSYDDIGNGVMVQPDGKIIVAGFSNNGSNQDFSLIRLNADGTLDTSFNSTGKAIVPLDGGSDYGYGATLQPDGKIIVAGFSDNGGIKNYSLIRLNADGTLDTGFDGDGKLLVPIHGSYDLALSVTVQPDGKILVAGYSGYYDFSLIRLNTDGTLDTTFNGNGKAIVPVGFSLDVGRSVTVQPDGKILVAGYSNSGINYEFSLIRLNADGSLDTSFDGDGKLLVPVAIGYYDVGNSVTVQPDGKIIVAGYSFNGSNQDFSLVRLNADGSLDSTFNGSGKLLVPVGSSGDDGNSVTLQPDGKIVVAGGSYNGINYDFSLIRLNADGTLDDTFNGDGKLLVPMDSGFDFCYRVTIQTDGKIIVAGSSFNDSNYDFSLIRVNADRSLDTTFNGSSLNTLGASVTYTENDAPIALDNSVAIYDADLAALNGGLGNYSGAGISLSRHGGASAQDMFSGLGNLVFTGDSGDAVLSGVTVGTFTNTAGTLNITFNANATQARGNELLSSIGYANASDAPPASVQIDWTFSDGNSGGQGSGDALTTTGSTTVNIAAVNDAGSVTITGMPTEAQTLTANVVDPDGLGAISYQWTADGIVISGATNSTYTLTQAEIGKTITVTANYTDAYDATESVTSTATAAVGSLHLITGAAKGEMLNGTSGGDYMIGLGGNDWLNGKGGNDTLDGGAGRDILAGGAGNDLYLVDLTSAGILEDIVIELPHAGIDTIQLRGTSTNTLASTLTLGANIENLDASGTGSSLLNLTGNALNNTIIGNAANNVITGGAGADNLDGGNGSDIYIIAQASDYAPGEVIRDTGTTGTDEIRFTSTHAGTLVLSSAITSIDSVVIGRGTAVSAVTSNTTALNVNASAVPDGLNMTGNAGANTLTGTAFDDKLFGGAGNDILNGGGGNDQLFGGTGNDILNGGNGNDQLYGGAGNDLLSGGAGSDCFVFNTAPRGRNNVATITDFKPADDQILLSNAIFKTLGAAGSTLAEEAFYAAAGATHGLDAGDRIVYNTTTGALYYDADGSGNMAAVQITLIGMITHPTLTHSDFDIIDVS